MAKARVSRRQEPEMGQTSSQLGPATPLEPIKETDTPLRKSKSKKRGKRAEKGTSMDVLEKEADEEGTAHALMQLRANAVLHARRSSNDDDLAASAQLIGESSPVRPSKSLEAMTYSGDHEKHGHGTTSRKKKYRRDTSDSLPVKALDPEVERSPDAQYKRDGHRHPFISPSDLPGSSLSLDDIDSNDEAVASYLQEYENGASGHLTQIDNSEHKYSKHRATTKHVMGSPDDSRHLGHGSPSSVYIMKAGNRKRKRLIDQLVQPVRDGNYEPSDETSRLSYEPNDSSIRTEAHKRKRQKATGSALHDHSNEHQGLQSDTGQHIFDHDYEAFDRYMVEDEMQLANSLECDSGHAMPIDPQLIRESGVVEQPVHGKLTDADNEIAPQTNGKKGQKRISSKPKQPRASKHPGANGSSPAYTSPYASNGNQRDRNSPYSEDSQRRPSPELEFSRSVGVDSNGPPSTGKRSHHKETASKSKKRSNSLGTVPGNFERGRSKHQPSLQEITEKGGIFTVAEVVKLDTFRDRYCEENDMSTRKYNELIHGNLRGNNQVHRLYHHMYEVLPYRKATAIRRFCRRRYHNCSARGVWTKEEDEMLKQAVAEKGKAWKAVGDIVERLPEDCRDRWRNYLIIGDNRNVDKWTDGETKNLVIAVHDCIQTMREMRRVEKETKYDGRDVPVSEPDTDEEAEEMKLINWQAVSDRMGENGGGRSRLQCSHKYAKLKSADRRKYMRLVKEGEEAMRRLEEGLPQKKSSLSNDGWRLRKAKRKVANMKHGDKYDLLQILSNCNAAEESEIPWKYLGDAEFQAKWSKLERVAAWEMMKNEARTPEGMDYHDVVNRLLTRMMAEDYERLDDRWDPERDEDVRQQPGSKKPTRKQEKKGRDKPKKTGAANGVKPKSAEFVLPSDDEDVDRDETGHERTEADIEYEIRNSSKVASSSNTDDEMPDLQTGDVSDDAGQSDSEVEVEESEAEEVDEKGESGNGSVSDDLGDEM